MAEYIDKGALYTKIANLEEIARNRFLDTPSNNPLYSPHRAQMNERTFFKHLIFDFPAADVAPVRHGCWILQGNKIGLKVYECSECKDDDYWKKNYCFGDESFCPNCGARMDGDCYADD